MEAEVEAGWCKTREILGTNQLDCSCAAINKVISPYLAYFRA